MKKASTILSTIFTIIGLVGIVVFTIYFVVCLTGEFSYSLLAKINNEEGQEYLGLSIGHLVLFLLLGVYSVFVTFTGLLTRRVVINNVLDKIKPFGILSIIFLNIPGGIITLVYDKQVKEELERTAPKGKRKEVNKE